MTAPLELGGRVEVAGWQPIECAPHDELEPLILFNGKVTIGARWEGGFADWLHDWMDPQPWCWMHLPPPPLRPRSQRIIP